MRCETPGTTRRQANAGGECRLSRCRAGTATPTRGRSTACASRRRGSSCACPTTRISSSSSRRRARASIPPARCRSAFPGRTGSRSPDALRALPLLLLDDARRAHRGGLVAAVRGRQRGPHRRHPGARRQGLRRQPQRVQRLVADGVGAGPRTRGRDARGGAAPRVRRPRRARGADVGLDDNPASQRVSLRLGYVHEGEQLLARRGEPTRHLRYRLPREAWQRDHFDGIEMHGLEPCLPCSALHELAANLYNHATMATPTTQPARHGADARALSAGIAGASGYAGRELVRLIAGHPQLALRTAQARSEGFDALSPRGARALRRRLPVPAPRGEPPVRRGDRGRRHAGRRPRLRLPARGRLGLRADGAVPRRTCSTRAQIANPGCYATAAILALAPLAEAGLLDAPVAIDGKSGISGAGREPTELTHVSEIEGGVQPYKPTGHRHIAEIERSLARLAGEAVPVTFTPHSRPTRAASR